MTRKISIYVHIPFCEKKCTYCAFNSFCATQQQKENYIDLLCKEIEFRAKDFAAAGAKSCHHIREKKFCSGQDNGVSFVQENDVSTNANVGDERVVVQTIYFGGGTPSVLSGAQFEKIVRTIFDNFDVDERAEFTVEVNPNSVDEALLKTYKSLRVNRLSVGVQSLDDKVLRQIGRLHNKKMALEKIALIRKFFDNVSADLIVGLQGEDGKTLCRHAKQLLALGVKHISCYLLEIYENTPIFQMIRRGEFVPLDDGQQIAAFEKLSAYLVDNGFERYEISNFALPGYESRHNLNYWARGEYLGFGIGAHSFLNGVRTENAATLAEYEKQLQTKKCSKIEVLSAKEEDEEKIMLGLRCCLGVKLDELKEIDLTKNPYFKQYLDQGILTLSGNVLHLNPMFYHISNTIISNLF